MIPIHSTSDLIRFERINSMKRSKIWTKITKMNTLFLPFGLSISSSHRGNLRLRITLYQRPPERGSDSLYLRLTEKWSGSSKVGFVSSRLLASRKFSCWRMKYRNDPFFTKRSIRNKNDVHKWLILFVGDLMGWTPDRKRKSTGNLWFYSIENHRAFHDQWSPIGFVIFVE